MADLSTEEIAALLGERLPLPTAMEWEVDEPEVAARLGAGYRIRLSTVVSTELYPTLRFPEAVEDYGQLMQRQLADHLRQLADQLDPGQRFRPPPPIDLKGRTRG